MISNEYKELLEGLFEGAYVVDRKRKILFWNQGAVNITGYGKDEVLHMYCFNNILRHVDDDGKQLCMDGCPLQKTIETGIVQQNKVYLHHKKGHRVPVNVRTSPIYDDEGNIIAALEVFTDASYSASLYSENKRLQELTTKDHLTQVYNRGYISYQIDSLIKEQGLFDQNFGLVFVDIDDFKSVNDTFGHQTGDEVLKLIARTMKHNIRDEDLVGRYGGEEFILLLKVSDEKVLQKVANKIRVLVQNSSIVASNSLISVTISMGASMYIKGESKEELIERADQAMYQSKNTGKNKVTIA